MVKNNNIVLFDGVCNLCNGFVNFLIKQDRYAKLSFASLQSDAAQNLFQSQQISLHGVDSVVFLKDGVPAVKSDAVIEILKFLGGGWRLAVLGYMIPKPIRNLIYDWVARNRYRWFGKRPACLIPNQDILNRFL